MSETADELCPHGVLPEDCDRCEAADDVPDGWVTQIELVCEILRFLDRRKVPVNHRQMNAIIGAANGIIDELRRPHTEATAGCGMEAWLASDSTGVSSLYMARHLASLAGLGAVYAPPHDEPFPHDPSDFGRCVGLLDAVPELRPHLATLADGHGPVWAGLVAAWGELEALFREELPSGKAPKLYKRMREIIDAGRKERVKA